MADIEITSDTINSLAAKAEALELTTEERAVLDRVLERAAEAEAEVEGFGVVYEIEVKFKGTDEELQAVAARKWGRALGFGLPDMRVSIDPEHDTPAR